MMSVPNNRHWSINVFKKATGTRQKVTQETFKKALVSLQDEVQSGFTEKEIEVLVTYIVLLNIPANQLCALIKCLVPQTLVSQKATNDVLTWIISHFRSAPKTCVVTALQWITGLVEYKLADIDLIDGYYEVFFVLQRISYLEPHACKLIYLLTKADDIVRWKVQDVRKCHLKNNGNHMVALLCKFKSLKPELVPETVPAKNYHSTFKEVAWFTKNFQPAVLRNNIALEQGERHLMWVHYKSIQRGGKRAKIEVIPTANYIHVGSRLYNKKKKKLSILEFKNVVSVACNLLNLEPPCNSMSLLANKMGHHILAFGDEELQMRFSVTLLQQLGAVFHRRDISHEEKENLLKQLVKVEEHMQQGIPVVSIFLAQYLTVWDGDDYQKYIFKLLEWVTFDSFEDFKCDILNNIHSLFFTSNIETKCLIIATMRRLLHNMFIAATCQHGGERPQITWDASTTLPQVIMFVENLCSLGLLIEGGNIALLDESFAFYEMVSHLEEYTSLVLFTLIPAGVLYRGLFTRVASFIERVCSLLIRYKTVHTNKLRALKSRAIFTQKFEMVNIYAVDVLNCLWNDRIISSRKEGHIFKGMSRKVLNTFLNQVQDLDKRFSVSNHVALYLYSNTTQAKSTVPSNMFIAHKFHELFPNIMEIKKG